MEFGERLRDAREQRGLSQQALADRFYVTRQTVSRWERGDRYPDLLTLKKLAVFFGLTVDEFLSGEDFTVMPEKTQLMDETPNRILSILFGLSAVLLINKVFREMLAFPSYVDVGFAGSALYLLFMLSSSVLKAVCLSFGLYMAVTSSDTPSRVRWVICPYLVLEALGGLRNLFFTDGIFSLAFALLLVGIHLLGAVSAFRYFGLEARGRKTMGILLFVSLLLAVLRSLSSAIILYSTVEGYAMDGSNIPAVISLLVHSSFLYQAWRLEERRKFSEA